MFQKIQHILLYVFIFLCGFPVYPWGFKAHRQINQDALTLVAPGLRQFFTAYSDSIVNKAVEPDTRKKTHPEEYPRHFLDIDKYGEYPVFSLPHMYNNAAAQYGEETLEKNGTLPWWINWSVDSLTVAMRSRNLPGILHWAAFLGHYVADAHQPLHAIKNYDGQLTGNKGIHRRYETAMVDHYFDQYHFHPVAVDTISSPLDAAFAIIKESYLLSPIIIQADDIATCGMSQEDIEALHQHYDLTRDSVYFSRLYEQLGTFTWNRLSLASSRLALFWNYAWEQAGRPDLSNLK